MIIKELNNNDRIKINLFGVEKFLWNYGDKL